MGETVEDLLAQMQPPLEADPGDDAWDEAFATQLRATADLWFRAGYGGGITAYLNFFLLADFIDLHDRADRARFASMRSMGESFYRTDLFVRRVTDSGAEPTGGISNPSVRKALRSIMQRHARLAIPPWMMTYFGYQLLEAVEQECSPVGDDQAALHLSYMTTTYRIMGIAFSDDRPLMRAYARAVETRHAAPSPALDRHARNILRIGEMVGVRSARIPAKLPEATRAVYAPVHRTVCPGPLRRALLRAAGRLLMRRAIGRPRVAVPWTGAR